MVSGDGEGENPFVSPLITRKRGQVSKGGIPADIFLGALTIVALAADAQSFVEYRQPGLFFSRLRVLVSCSAPGNIEGTTIFRT